MTVHTYDPDVAASQLAETIAECSHRSVALVVSKITEDQLRIVVECVNCGETFDGGILSR